MMKEINQTKIQTPLNRIVRMIPGNQELIVKDYLYSNTYLKGKAVYACNELVCNTALRKAEVYRISYDVIEQSIVIEVVNYKQL